MGLIKTGLKAAVAVKVGHMVHDRIQQRQQAQWTAAEGHPAPTTSAPTTPEPASPSTPAAAPVGDVLAQLAQLGDLKAAGVVTEAEFEAQKARILSS